MLERGMGEIERGKTINELDVDKTSTRYGYIHFQLWNFRACTIMVKRDKSANVNKKFLFFLF
jgi:hypothetical protein